MDRGIVSSRWFPYGNLIVFASDGDLTPRSDIIRASAREDSPTTRFTAYGSSGNLWKD